MNAFQTKFAAVQALANAKSLKIYRYSTNKGRGCTVSYGLASIGTRPYSSFACQFRVQFSGNEGSTERCQHYAGLVEIETYLNGLK
ncbi:MAG: hypothetical protein A2508_07700 [Candidatus Lambdaproteobacteria bacterium RIFOXYD12_FULL_49_8]|uniref:Uncharacterized protein n=1 Tax=Candidatus Lambdaproteobacteria bacterium RIFOXYD2_FULL_50_16 TaxID=1817772 RepID=A0A1F6GAG5_9PROT|nr:MAG: hypothetical protein A2527_10155 [Candidatus Lambdaproteobacteria bacterium RIFOXYD2_FULL_50_16]OGG96248.1 MAG: hypothetical protein A2508_07700 [Candidatus Lambdaproteobacteria bacterium RIFOXYD12_FULL_49_8]